MSPSVVDMARRVLVASYVALLAVLSVQVFGNSVLQPQTRGFLWVVSIGPLLVFLPGLLRGAWRTCIWLCFVLLVYFMASVIGLADASNAVTEWLQLMLVCVVFVTAMLYARWRRQELAGQGA